MPGIFGFRLRRQDADAGQIAARFARDLCLYEWQRSQVCATADASVYLGVAWNDLAPAARGASFHAGDDVTCVLDGYISRVREDCGATTALADCRYAEAAVLAYHRFGVDFALQLEGPFSLVLHDRRDGFLFGVTERHGLSPLYRYDGPDSVCFSSMLGPMARSNVFPASIDPAAVATHLGHNHLFYRQALLQDVVLQDPATVSVSRPNEPTCEVGKYWHYGWDGPRDDASFEQKIDRLCDTLLAATDRIIALPGKPGASLSGGLDSRLMVGLAHRQGASLEPWTIGGSDAADMVVAAEICRKLGMEHHIFAATPDGIPEHAGIYATTLNGSGPLHNAYALDRCHAYRGQVDRMYNGYRGGVLLGKAVIDLGFKQRLRWWRGRLHAGPTVVSPNLEDARDAVAMSDFYRALSHTAKPRIAEWAAAPEPSLDDMFAAALAGPLAATPPEYRIEQWAEEFGGGRHYTLTAIFADRHFFCDTSIFYDYDVRDQCFSIQPADRRDNKAYITVLQRLLPDLAAVTYANTGFPANQSGLKLLMNRSRRRLMGGRVKSSTGVDPADWLRRPGIRDFCGDMIHSRLFLSRPWWRGDLIVSDFNDYLNGDSGLVNELWNAVTLELFVERWLD